MQPQQMQQMLQHQMPPVHGQRTASLNTLLGSLPSVEPPASALALGMTPGMLLLQQGQMPRQGQQGQQHQQHHGNR